MFNVLTTTKKEWKLFLNSLTQRELYELILIPNEYAMPKKTKQFLLLANKIFFNN